MADKTMNVVQALSAMTPTANANSATQAPAQPGKEFSNVLTTRQSQAAPQTPGKPAQAPQGKAAQGPADKAKGADADAAQASDEAPVQDGSALERLLAAMKADTSEPAAEDDPLAAVKDLIAQLTKPEGDKADDKADTATDVTTDPATLIAMPVVVTDNIAPAPASIADETAAGTDQLTDVLQESAGKARTAPDASTTLDTRDATHTADSQAADSYAAHAAAAASQHAQTGAVQARQDIPQHTVNTPVDSPNWAEDVGQKLVWTAHRDTGKASLVLTPPNMGRVEVSINVNGDQATASFVAASNAARDALNDSMPRLREVLAQAGIHLGQTDVSAGQTGQHPAQNPWQGERRGGMSSGGYGGDGGNANVADVGAMASRAQVRSGNGLVDTFV
ncbi:MAG: flagellar hook-length control protein FliK [Rhodocyclaceae bacterium]